MRKFFFVATEVTGALICVARFRKGREREFWARPLARFSRFSRVRNPLSLSFQTGSTRATGAQFLVEKYGNWEMNSENTFDTFDDHIHFKLFGET